MIGKPASQKFGRHYRNAVTIAAGVLGVAAGAGVFFMVGEESPPASQPVIETVMPARVAEAETGELRPAFSLPDVSGQMQDVSQWDGQLLVINFWATWCAPCRHEIPIFVELQTLYAERGLQFVGIAIDDPASINEFAAEVGMNYPRLHGQLDAMDVSKQYGNSVGGLPFTVVVDRNRQIVARKSGAFERDEIESLLREHL